MPPKAKFTKDEFVNAAMEIVREDGIDGLTSRALGTKLGSSARPIFTVFQNMDELKYEVVRSAGGIYQSYITKEISENKYPPYKASGIAYIKFAGEEKELFKLLFMRDRTGEKISENREELRPILKILMNNLKISEDEAFAFHLEEWLFVHGIATMVATSYLEWDMEFISKAITDAYEGLKSRYIGGK